jgi:catalase
MSLANFQRDGRGVHDDNQGSRPNYPSTQQVLNLPKRAYNDANHTIWVKPPLLRYVNVAEITNLVYLGWRSCQISIDSVGN